METKAFHLTVFQATVISGAPGCATASTLLISSDFLSLHLRRASEMAIHRRLGSNISRPFTCARPMSAENTRYCIALTNSAWRSHVSTPPLAVDSRSLLSWPASAEPVKQVSWSPEFTFITCLYWNMRVCKNHFLTSEETAATVILNLVLEAHKWSKTRLGPFMGL